MTLKRVLLSLAVVLLPCAVHADAPRQNTYTQPHVLRFAEAEDIAGLNPLLQTQSVVANLSQMTMGHLFKYDSRNLPIPELATAVPTKENGGISADGMTVVLHIRQHVKWSDGTPFDADDVVFSIDAMNNPANNIPSRTGFDRITKVEEPNKSTVVLELKQPYSPVVSMFDSFGGWAVLPKHILGSLPNINNAPYNDLPIGIGPFRYTAWRRGDAVEMEANPYYWRGRPKLDKIIYKLIPDRNTVLTQLQTGELDLWYPTGGAYLSRVENIPSVTVLRQPAYIYNHMDFNVRTPALRDVVVRRALELATNRAELLEKVAHGVGYLQESVLPEPYPGVSKIPFVSYDVAKANVLLDRDGWKRGVDGIRVKNGLRLSIEVATSSGTPDVDVQLELIRENWQQIGAEMTVKRYLSALLFAPREEGGIIFNSKFDVAVIAWSVPPVDDLRTGFGCDAIPPNGENIMNYCNHALDPLFDDFYRQYGAAAQGRDLSKIARIVAQDVPTVVTYSRQDVFAYNKDLKNFHPNNVTVFDDMMNVDI